MNRAKLFDSVALLEDLPEQNLKRGQVGAIVEVYNDGEAFEVEFVDLQGKTYGFLTLRPEQFIVLSHDAPERVAA